MPETSTLISQAYVKVDGADAPDDFMRDLVEIVVETSLHLPDVATVRLHDPHLQWIDDPRLAPGKTLVVSAKGTRPGESAQPVFDGEIVELEPDFRPGTQQLTVRAFNRLHRLTRGQYVRSFLNVSDGDLVQKVAQEVGLRAQVEPTNQIHPYVLQNNQTNLEFLRERVGALGFLLFVQGTTLHCAPPQANGGPAALEWGRTLTEFRPRLTTLRQINGVTVRGWDPAQKREIVGRAQNGQGAPQVGDGKTGGDVAKEAFHLEAPSLVTDRPIRTQAAADRVAQAVADRAAGSFIEADGTCAGNPAITAGSSVRLSAIGDRFGGTYFVTAATHLYSAEHGYTTQFSVSGQRPDTLIGLLSPPQDRALIPGLVIGIVTDNDDPNGEGRVKVKYPSLSADHASDWARVVSVGAGAERGLECLPEINDEVLVGFELGDVHCPYVLGGLWNGKDAPPKPKSGQVVSGGKVQKRILRSRTGHIITLDDSDGGGGISIEDSQGNKLVLDSQKNTLSIEIKGDASLKADGKLTLEAKGAVEIKGMGATVDAGTGSVEVKGMGAKLDGGASTVDVKGTMINLN